MAIGADAATQLAGLIQPLFLGKKSTTTNSVDPSITANFNSILSGLMPNVQNSAVTQEDMDALLQGIMAKGTQAFGPSKAIQAGAGAYNTTALDAMRNDAMAKATNESISAMLQAKLQGNQQQTQAAQVAAGANAQMGQLTSSQTQATPAALGSAALPIGAYALYKMMTGEQGTAAGKAGGATPGASAPQAAASNLPSNVNTLTAPSVVTGGGVEQFLSTPSGTNNFGVDAAIGSFDPYAASAPASFALNPADVAAKFKSPLAYDDAMATGGLGELGSDFGSLGSIDEALGFTAPGTADFGGGLGSFDQLAGTAEAASNVGSGGLFGLDLTGTIGDITSGISDAVGSIPGIGGTLVEAGGSIGETLGGINDMFTPNVDFGFGDVGIPLLSGAGEFLQGDFEQGAVDIAKTMALNAIVPGLGFVVSIGESLFGGCYITTAVTEATGGGDDAPELEILRAFRDDFMAATPAGQELIQNYYEVAPKVVEVLSAREDAKQVYTYLYGAFIKPAVAQVAMGDNYGALETYRKMSEFAESLATSKEGS